MSLYWTLNQKTNSVSYVEADSHADAVLKLHGVTVKPASPVNFDFVTQSSDSNFYEYHWRNEEARSDLAEQ